MPYLNHNPEIKIRMALETTVGTISEKHSIEFYIAHDVSPDFIDIYLDKGTKALKKAIEDKKK